MMNQIGKKVSRWLNFLTWKMHWRFKKKWYKSLECKRWRIYCHLFLLRLSKLCWCLFLVGFYELVICMMPLLNLNLSIIIKIIPAGTSTIKVNSHNCSLMFYRLLETYIQVMSLKLNRYTSLTSILLIKLLFANEEYTHNYFIIAIHCKKYRNFT